jgi:toxin ParE1/3/4
VSLPVVWLPEAQAELIQALERYDGIRPELGEQFASAVMESVEAIASTPLRFAVVDKSRRRAGVRRFPYGLFFLVEETRVVVIACFHGKRDPRRWQQRES